MTTSTKLTTNRKSLTINLDESKYGTFAEIGAGQEVARQFFQAGGAAGTIAKSMSAYDMKFSDAIYGKSKRYVSRERLSQMLDREYGLLHECLHEDRGESTSFFVFANTVSARNYRGTNECHGWMGVRFQPCPESEPSEIVVHVRMLDHTNVAQQDALGIFGVNLLYGAFYYSGDSVQFIRSLADNIGLSRIEVDMIEFHGPEFENVDNRILSLQLIEHGFTHTVLFGPNKKVLQPSETLYKKAVLIQRGSFRPFTNVNLDMLNCAGAQFPQEDPVRHEEVIVLMEITMKALRATGKIDYKDFLARVDICSSLGHNVLISNYFEFYRLVGFLRQYTQKMIGIVLGINTLLQIFNDEYYQNLDGGLLEACGRLFKEHVKLYAYPMSGEGYSTYTQLRGEENVGYMNNKVHSELIIDANNLIVKENFRDLYNYLMRNNFIEPVAGYNADFLNVFSPKVLALIQDGKSGWEDSVPKEVAKIIKKKKLWLHEQEEQKACQAEVVL